MKRLFLAVDITPGATLLDAYDHIRHTLAKERINWVRNDQMHLTLSFLGDTGEHIIPDLVSGIGICLKPCNPFKLKLAKLGIFRNFHDPRVVWIGCESEKEFQDIKTATDRVIESFGYKADRRPFAPHLTLGRIKTVQHPDHLSQLIDEYKNISFQTETIGRIVLYESHLTTEGPQYKSIEKFRLGG